MNVTMETIHKDIEVLKKDMNFIKRILIEDFELSDEAKKGLKEARATPDSEYVDLE